VNPEVPAVMPVPSSRRRRPVSYWTVRRRASGADPRSRPRKCPSVRSWGAN